MIYAYIAIIVALGSVLFPVLIGTLISRKNPSCTMGWGLVATACYWFITWFYYFKFSEGFYGPTPYLGSIFFGFVIAFIVCFFSEGSCGTQWTKAASFNIVLALASLGIMIFVDMYLSSDMFGNAKPKAALIGSVNEVTDLNQAMSPADTAHICLVDEDMAKVAAQNALSKFKTSDGSIPGSRYEIGAPTKQYVDGQLWWIFPIEFQGWLKWRMDPQVPGYLRVSAEDPYAEGQAVQTNRDGQAIEIKYLNSACWEYKAERHLRYDGFMHTILEDWTFEPDDN